MYIYFQKSLSNFIPTYWNTQAPNPLPKPYQEGFTFYTLNDIVSTLYIWLQTQQSGQVVEDIVPNTDLNYGITCWEATVNAIYNKTFPNAPVPEWINPSNDPIITEKTQEEWRLQILSFIGNIINLPPFFIKIFIGFTLSVAPKDMLGFPNSNYKLGHGTARDYLYDYLTSQQYAGAILARKLTIYSTASIPNIILAVSYITLLPAENISISLLGNEITVSITGTATNLVYIEAIINYRDQFGAPLYPLPSYGNLIFEYLP